MGRYNRKSSYYRRWNANHQAIHFLSELHRHRQNAKDAAASLQTVEANAWTENAAVCTTEIIEMSENIAKEVEKTKAYMEALESEREFGAVLGLQEGIRDALGPLLEEIDTTTISAFRGEIEDLRARRGGPSVQEVSKLETDLAESRAKVIELERRWQESARRTDAVEASKRKSSRHAALEAEWTAIMGGYMYDDEDGRNSSCPSAAVETVWEATMGKFVYEGHVGRKRSFAAVAIEVEWEASMATYELPLGHKKLCIPT